LEDCGIYTILVDGAKEPVVLPYADTFYQVDIFNVEMIKEIALS